MNMKHSKPSNRLAFPVLVQWWILTKATNSVRVDFEDNPLEQPIWARLERHFRKSELKLRGQSS